MITAVRGAVERSGLVVLRGQVQTLEEQVQALEEEVQECRELNRRIAELTDIVTELLLPVAQRDESRVRALLSQYQDRL